MIFVAKSNIVVVGLAKVKLLLLELIFSRTGVVGVKIKYNCHRWCEIWLKLSHIGVVGLKMVTMLSLEWILVKHGSLEWFVFLWSYVNFEP